ncbi:hypothetical protein J31TS4_17830 [Paenibacillus sp. J31TS4]|nr:hypothetical protein J31TS4_17830 [Paenibacillus sp. J31TS4]
MPVVKAAGAAKSGPQLGGQRERQASEAFEDGHKRASFWHFLYFTITVVYISPKASLLHEPPLSAEGKRAACGFQGTGIGGSRPAKAVQIQAGA